MDVALYAGGNFVVYTGQARASLDALDSIAPYLDPDSAVWYWNNYTGAYEIVQTPGIPVWDRNDMVPYGCYWIKVTQNCTWTYGPEETAPTSVYLYADRYNIVAYSGPEQSIEAGFASIIDFLANWYYSDKDVWTQPRLMVPNGVYAVFVTQTCEWKFEVEVPPVAGAITQKELDYQNIWQVIPLSDIPVGTRVRLRIWGRNDTSINQKMGIYWHVADPEGYIAQEYTDWETFWTGPGLEQGFVGVGFDLSKVGKYTMWVELLMNPDDPQIVDRYSGDLCTVAVVVPEPEFRSFGVAEYNKV